MPPGRALNARLLLLTVQLACTLLCCHQTSALAAEAAQKIASRSRPSMFAGRSVDRLVPMRVLSKSQVAWACQTSYRLIGPDMRVDNEKLRAAIESVWSKFNQVPNLQIKMDIVAPALAEGTKDNHCGPEDDHEDCFRLSDELAANYGAIDIHVLSGVSRATQFPEIGEKEWTYNRMLETTLRDRGVNCRVISLRLKAMPEGVHVLKYLPLTPLYAEEVMFQLYGRELLPFDVTKQNALYASLDLIGLNNLAGVGWVEIASISEAWHWKPTRGDVGVANITIRTQRDRTGASMGEHLMMQLPRLLDRLDEIGLRRVDGEVLWSHMVTDIAPQDQIAGYLSPDDPVRSFDTRDSPAFIESYPPKRQLLPWWFLLSGAAATLLAMAGGMLYTHRLNARQPAVSGFSPTPTVTPMSSVTAASTPTSADPALARLTVPPNNAGSGMLRGIPSNPSPAMSLPAYSSASPLTQASLTQHNSTCSDTSSEAQDTFNAFRRQRSRMHNADFDINALGDSATETAGLEGLSETRRRAYIQAELRKAHSLKGWEIPFDSITICQKEDGSDWLLGAGGFGKVYKGLRSGVQDVAIKVLTYSEELLMQQFWVEIELMKQLSYDGNIVQFYGCVIDTPNPILVLELMEGGDLRSALSGPMGPYNSWYKNGQVIAMDIVRGVFYLHNKNVIHGDLKSKNVLLSRNFTTAKLSDVGMARVHASTVVTGELNQGQKGTFSYAAPELLLGQRCTDKADIFSLGVTLWEICTREVPIRGRMRDLTEDDCPQAIIDLIAQCRLGEPDKRPTAKEVFDVLKKNEDRGLRSASSTSSGAFPSKLSLQRMQMQAELDRAAAVHKMDLERASTGQRSDLDRVSVGQRSDLDRVSVGHQGEQERPLPGQRSDLERVSTAKERGESAKIPAGQKTDPEGLKAGQQLEIERGIARFIIEEAQEAQAQES